MARLPWARARSGFNSRALAEPGDRRVPLPCSAVSLTQSAVVLGDAGVDGDRPADQVDRRSQVAGLTGQDAQQMERIGMVGDLGQDLAIDRLRLGQPAGLVMPDGDLHRLVDRDPCHRS